MINEIPVKLPQQLLITKISTSFYKNFDPISMINIFEAEKIEPAPTFEKNINEIKYNYPKSIASTAMNLWAITYFDKNFDPIFMNNGFETAKFEPEPTFENTINEIKYNHLKMITSIDMHILDIPSNKPFFLLNI